MNLRKIKFSKPARWIIGAVPVCFSVLLFLHTGLDGTEPHRAGHVEKITIGVAANMDSALVYIAEAKGFFVEHGLAVTVRDYSTGLLAMQDLARDRLDMATCTDAVFVIQSAEQKDLRIFATIARADDHEMIIRRESGISSPADLRGKRIAVTLKTSGHFFLETFLSFYGIPIRGVLIVDLPPPGILKAMKEGDVDAACTWEPTVGRIRGALGDGGFSWPVQKGRSYNWLFAARDDFLNANASAVSRFLKSLLAAEAYARISPQGALETVGQRLMLPDPEMKSAWPKFDFRVTLDQDLISIMEDQARWAVRRSIIPKESVPDYFGFIEMAPLERINPDAVGIIH